LVKNKLQILDAKFLHNPNDAGNHCHCPTLLETQSGNLLVAWYAYPDQEHIGATLALARYSKEQDRWLPSQSIISKSGFSRGNPVLFQDSEGKVWLLFVALKGNYWNDAILEGAWSEDEGQTWSNPIQLGKKPGLMVRHPPIILGSQSLLLPAYEEKTRQTVLMTAHPPYKIWKETYRFSDLELIQPVLLREKSDRLSLFFRPCDNPRLIWRSHSSNNGNSWSVPIRTSLPNPLSGVAAFTVGDSTALVYNHTEEHQRFPLSISITNDGGTTWEDPWHFETVNNEVSYPSFINGRDEKIHGVYTYNRRMIKYVLMSR
jgi:predicted neuraminidase